MSDELNNPDSFGKVLDTDVASQSGGFLDSPDSVSVILDSDPLAGKTRAREIATQNAMIQGQVTDKITLNTAALHVDGEAALDVEATKLYAQIQKSIASVGDSFAEISPQDMTGVLEQVVTAQVALLDEQASPVATELAIIKGSTDITLDEAVEKELAFNLAANNIVADLVDKAGIWETVTNVTGNFYPLRNGMDWADVRENVQEHAELKSAISGNSIPGMIGSWQALPTDLKEKLFPFLVEAVLAATGVDYNLGVGLDFLKSDKNVLNAAGILIRFLQPEGASRADLEANILLGIDVASILPIGAIGRALKISKLAATATTSAAAGARIAKITKLSPTVRKNMEFLMAKGGDYLRKRNHPVKIVANAGDKKKAAAMNLAAMADDDMARAYGLPSDAAYNNAMPKVATPNVPEFVEDLASETAQQLTAYAAGRAGFRRSMTSESKQLYVGALGESERAVVVRNFYDDMDLKSEDLLQEGISLTKVKVIPGSINKEGFTYEYVLTNTKHLELVGKGELSNLQPKTHTAFRSWRINEVTGNFDETAADLTSTITSSRIPGQSPMAWSKTKPGAEVDFNDASKAANLLEDQVVANKQRLNERWIDANKDISGLRDFKARARIESIELAADEYINKGTQIRGKVFTERELISGIKTGDGIVYLTKSNEIQAYYKRRLFADDLWNTQNYVTRREYQLAGFSDSIMLKGQGLAVKRFETAEGAMMSAARRTGRNVYLSGQDETVALTDDLIAAQYAQGKVLIRSRNDWNVTGAGDLARGGEVVEYMFVNPKNLRGLPQQVIQYKIGYVPKINEGIEFVVKRKMPVEKMGVTGATRDTALRAFSSRADAELFKQQQIAKLIADSPKVNPKDIDGFFEVADGSAMAQLERMENALSGSGGLFTGTRSADDLLMGLEGVPIERMAPGEAFGRYIDHLGQVSTRNEWRIGQEQTWLNTVKNANSKIPLEGFNGTLMPNNPEGKALNRMRDQINIWNRSPSRQESLFEGLVQKYHDGILNVSRNQLGLNKNSIKHALWLKHLDPVAALLSSSMHLMLGSLNPAQLYVQASAAVVGLSLVPILKVPGVIAHTARLSVLDNIRDLGTHKKVIDLMTSSKQILKQDDEMYTAWRRSGLYESVRSNADMNYISNTGVGITNDILRKADNASLIFYRAGELTNRRMSFLSAYTRWKTVNPKKALDNTELLKVVQEANKTMLELTGANKAYWQGGAGSSTPQRLLSVTTQFQQVLAKTMELTLKGESRGGFSNIQKSRIAAGQLLMFGSVGVPIINAVAPSIMDWLDIEDDAAGTIANRINQGATGAVVKEVFGANIDISSRSSVFFGTTELIKDMVASKDPMWSKFAGVFGTTGRRIANVAIEATDVARAQLTNSYAFESLAELEPLLLHDRSGEEDMDEPTMLETVADIAVILSQATSFGRNIAKARMMHNSGRILDRRSKVIIDAREEGGFSFADKIGVAAGFQLTREERERIVLQDNKGYQDEMNVAADVITKSMHRFIYTHDMNPKYSKSVTRNIQMVQEGMLGGDTLMIDTVMEQVKRSVFDDNTSREHRELKKFFERTAPEKISAGVMLDTSITLGKVFNKQAIVKPFQATLEQENK